LLVGKLNADPVGEVLVVGHVPIVSRRPLGCESVTVRGVPNVKVGFFSFTEVLDDRHREYNKWHLFDHMPEQFKLEGLHWGQRWVATPELIGRRLLAGDELGRTQYVTLYLITDPVQQALDDFYALARELHAKDRWFEARKSHL